MAKRYKITETQYKTILEHLDLNKPEMLEQFYSHEESPEYTLTDLQLEEFGGEQVLAFYFSEEGSKRTYKGTVDQDGIDAAGLDMQTILQQFKSTGTVDHNLEKVALQHAEMDHDGVDDSDFYGN